mmetsp:Transcript_1859/g.3357  ORF Transcript_1859/g.3357 Transcript_1859/m.3357 type:complete len:300 (+) Transcript_1859:151-1050(+)
MTMATKRKRINNVLPNNIISSLETSDRKAAKLRKSLISTETLPKSLAAKSQVDIQTKLIECRILIQRALSSFSEHSVPDGQEEESGDKSTSRIDKCLDNLLTELIGTREALHDSTQQTLNDTHVHKQDDRIEKEYSQLRMEWKTTLNKHHANIYLQNQQNKNKFQVVDQSFWSQIESNVEHSAMLDQVHSKKDDENKGSMGFDDTKLYQHMLQEYILLSAQGGKDGAATAAIERLNRSMKKNTRTDVDRRASKGRKIRYVVHEKLQNFTFPMGRPSGSVMDDDVLFKSMFGGVASKRKN